MKATSTLINGSLSPALATDGAPLPTGASARRRARGFSLAVTLGVGGVLALLAPVGHAAAPAKEAPTAVKAMLARMVGTWSSRDAAVTIGGKTMKAQTRVTCTAVTGGGIECRVHADVAGAPPSDETQLFGWDPESGKVHAFAVSGHYAHDHVGTLEGQVLSLAYSGTRDGAPWDESLSFEFKGDKELVWRDTCKSSGQVAFSGEGTFRK